MRSNSVKQTLEVRWAFYNRLCAGAEVHKAPTAVSGAGVYVLPHALAGDAVALLPDP